MERIIHKFVFICMLLGSSLYLSPARAAGAPVIYHDGQTELEGYWVPSACQDAAHAPLVLVFHQWKGLIDNEKMRAGMLADKCYNAFAVDMYGKGVRPTNTDDAGKEAGKYKGDPALARRRAQAALDYVLTRNDFDKTRIAAFGYCFGGTMALELARAGADLKGVVSFHGALATKAPVDKPGVIKAHIQVHHGADDPFVKQDEVKSFMDEMKAADTDWSITQYAHAVHAFTQKEAGDDPSKGMAYNEKADKRSWASAMDFLTEIFGRKKS